MVGYDKAFLRDGLCYIFLWWLCSVVARVCPWLIGVLIGLFKSVYDKLVGEVSGEIALNFVSEISSHHRIQASPGIRDAVNYAVATMKGYGLDACVHDWPADGKTFSWTSLHIEEWGCRDAGLRLVHPVGEGRHLCRFSEDKISVIQRSFPTPKGGVEGEVVILDKGEEEGKARNKNNG